MCLTTRKLLCLYFSDKPSNVSLNTNVTSKVCAGITVSFTCSAEANPPVHTYLLYENNASVAGMGNLGTAKRRIENAGRYIFRCEANNSVQGLSRSVDTMLTVDGKLEQLNFFILYYK